MITLYGTGPMFGLPAASPFVIKAEILLKMASVEYRNAKADLRSAPKGKMPWIDDNGTIVADTAFIKKHLEDHHGADFTGGYDARALGHGLALERMMEDHAYWMNTCIRWLQDGNFFKGPVHFFDSAPAPIRPLIVKLVRRQVRKSAHAHGMSRHNDAERLHLATLLVNALANVLGDNDYMLGQRVSGADASVYGHLASIEAPFFESPMGDLVRERPNLMTYLHRMREMYFPEREE